MHDFHFVVLPNLSLRPSSSFADPNSPSGTLLPPPKQDKFTAIGNGPGKHHDYGELSREGMQLLLTLTTRRH